MTKTIHKTERTPVTLNRGDFKRQPEYHLDMWEEICTIYDIPKTAEEVTLWCDTIDYA